MISLKYTHEGFDYQLDKDEESLAIKAEDATLALIFSKKLTNEIVKELGPQFPDIDTLFELFKDFFENKPDQVTLSLTKQGKLKYCCSTMLGNVPHKQNYCFQLEKLDSDPRFKLEKLVSKLSKKFSALESAYQTLTDKTTKEQNSLADFERQVLRRFDRLEKTLGRIEEGQNGQNGQNGQGNKINKEEKEMPLQKPKIMQELYRFNPAGAFSSKFTLSDENRTAKANTNSNFAIFTQEPLPKKSTSQFTFLIDEEKLVIVGIAPDTALELNNCILAPPCVGYQHLGYFFKDGERVGKNPSLPAYKKGDKINFSADLATGKIEIKLNGKEVASHTFSGDALEKYNFYPFLFTNCNVGAGASLV